MPMDKARYPADWEQIATAKKEAAGWKCERCGKQCRKPGEPFDTHKKRKQGGRRRMALQENVKFKRTCGSCKHYIGGGDWNLRCDQMYDLCYRNIVACDKYEFSQATINREEERRVKLAKWLQEQVEKANRKMER